MVLFFSAQVADGQEPTAVSVEDKFGSPDGTATDAIKEGEGDAATDATDSETPPTALDENAAGVDPAANADLVYLNATDVEIQDMIKQISKSTGLNFILDSKVRGKVTIISEKPMTKDMAYQAFLSALNVMGYTTVNTPGGLLKIVPTKGAVQEPIDLYKDQLPYTDRFITRIIQVQNISANDLASVVKSLVSKEGNLFAYPQTNSLILTDSGTNIDRILRIVKELDQEGPQEVIEIININYADASDITEKVLQLYESELAKGAGKGAARSRRGSPELEEGPSISKIISDERTNSVIVLGSKRAIGHLRGLIARLDTPKEGVEGSIHVYYLKHASAKEIADTLSSLVSGAVKKADKEGKGKDKAEEKAGAITLEGGVKVTADEGTNSLVITAAPKDFELLIQQVVNKLDIPRRQVYLEAVVMELQVRNSQSLGFSGNFGNIFNLAGSEVTGFGAVLPIATNAFQSIATAAGGFAGGGFSNRTIDITLQDGSIFSIPAVSAILQALQTDASVNVLSTPSILTLDNEEAQIQVGQEIGVPTGQSTSAAGTTATFDRKDTGIILKVTPQISESETVRLTMSQEITNVVPQENAPFGPTFTKRAINTVVVAKDKQTIVIGGLLEDNTNVSTTKVPLLGDVPVLGTFFRNRSANKVKTNILVFLTPFIIRDREDYLGILQKKIEERNLFVDLNFGYTERKKIRRAIKNHTQELLQYKPASQNIQTNGTSYQSSPPVTNDPPKVVEPGSSSSFQPVPVQQSAFFPVSSLN